MCVTDIVITKLLIQKEYIVPCENMLTLEVTKVEKSIAIDLYIGIKLRKKDKKL